MVRRLFVLISLAVYTWIFVLYQHLPTAGSAAFMAATPFFMIGLYDFFQSKHSIRRNFPVVGRFRYLLEEIRPEIQQYFIESNTAGVPFSREQRSLVYQRSKKVTDTIPFGTQLDVYASGYEWIEHSLRPRHAPHEAPRVVIGEKTCKQPYAAALLNISAMSYGSLSQNAVLALNKGAKTAGFYHNTGEGGVSPHHLLNGGDLVWQIGTGYFSCRNKDGTFCAETFAKNAQRPQIKMIEVKLSQGAKPGHGGILPAKKVNAEVAAIRGVEIGKDVISPPAHSAFTTPLEMMGFLTKLRELSGGKPVGFKLCLGSKKEFLSLCKAMVESGQHPDFITVDGGEGGTGAAPMEFTNSIGTPLLDALAFVDNALRGVGFRDRVKVIASGKVISGFQMAKHMALGADLCNSARGMLFALGCIQALRCNLNNCPTGVATQDKSLMKGLVVEDKYIRVANFQRETVKSFLEVLAAAGLEDPSKLTRSHIQRRVSSTRVMSYAQIYPEIPEGSLLQNEVPAYAPEWRTAKASGF